MLQLKPLLPIRSKRSATCMDEDNFATVGAPQQNRFSQKVESEQVVSVLAVVLVAGVAHCWRLG